MDKIRKILENTVFESSSSKTPQFIDFARKFRSELKKELKKQDAENFKISVGHFYISGFFTLKGQIFYFSLSDVRGSIMGNKLLIRTATDYKDYTGGSNHFFEINSKLANNIVYLFGLN